MRHRPSPSRRARAAPCPGGRVRADHGDLKTAHRVTVDGIPQVLVERLDRLQAEDDPLLRERQRAALEKLAGRDAQEHEAAGRDCMELLAQNQLGVLAFGHGVQIAARWACSVSARRRCPTSSSSASNSGWRTRRMAVCPTWMTAQTHPPRRHPRPFDFLPWHAQVCFGSRVGLSTATPRANKLSRGVARPRRPRPRPRAPRRSAARTRDPWARGNWCRARGRPWPGG